MRRSQIERKDEFEEILREFERKDILRPVVDDDDDDDELHHLENKRSIQKLQFRLLTLFTHWKLSLNDTTQSVLSITQNDSLFLFSAKH